MLLLNNPWTLFGGGGGAVDSIEQGVSAELLSGGRAQLLRG